ncbi:MAG: urease accessory protein [Bacteroidota bacterium]
MMTNELSLLLALFIGFTHAFEADHLVAVGNLVTRRNRLALAMKDGVYWGLGHSSTILLIGMVVILGRTAVSETVFGYLEAGVGVMLIGLGGWRLFRAYHKRHAPRELTSDEHDHGLAYGVGLVHGLAGSGALILLVLANVDSTWYGLLYLLTFGLGSVGGMLVAAGVLGLPFSRRVLQHSALQLGLVIVSSLLCAGYGAYVLYENMA